MNQIQAIRGMNDFLPDACATWQWIEEKIREVVHSYGYREIRTPIVEKTPLFVRSVGAVTDIVEKEIYTFDDRNGENLTLRPEGTAGCIRAGIEHGLFYNQTQRLWYMGPCFRYERPQKGRYRQFHQLGVEFVGVNTANADAEVILLLARLWEALGIEQHIHLEINTLGSDDDRARYRQVLVDYFQNHHASLDEDSQRRLQSNPLRILDSKNPQMQAIIKDAPRLVDFLSEESNIHFQHLQNILTHANVPFQVNHRLVRGLDYYSQTVFEWTTTSLGSQSAVCGGGRYNHLIEQLGGQSTPAVGFGLGLERLVLLYEALQERKSVSTCDVYVCTMGQEAQYAGIALTQQLRRRLPQLKIITDCHADNFKKQLKRADKSGAHYTLLIGEQEAQTKTVTVKNLRQALPQQTIEHEAVFSLLTNIEG